MSDFTIDIIETSTQLDIEAAIINNLEFNEVDYAVETTLFDTVINTLEIEKSESTTLQINTEYVGTVVFASDIIGLDNYLSNFIDSYEIDCGTP